MLRESPAAVYIVSIIMLLSAFAGAVDHVRVCDE